MELSVQDETIQLLKEIANLCKRPTDRNRSNVLLVGLVGAGKSAVINTIFKALTGKYYPIARTGGGGIGSVTLDLIQYRNCGITLHDLGEGIQKEILCELVSKLPNILDCAGREDIDTPYLEEMLELIISGCISPDTSLEEVERLQRQYGYGNLKKIVFKQPYDEWKVSTIVFVQSSRQNVPKQLIKCLTNILKLADQSTLQRKYPLDVIVLITKYDLVSKDTAFQRQNVSPDYISDLKRNNDGSMIELLQKENEIAVEFNMLGAFESNRIRWTSYTDCTSLDDPNIDNTALKFVRRLLVSGRIKQTKAKKVISLKECLLLHLYSMPRTIAIWHDIVSHSIEDRLEINYLQAQLVLTSLIVLVFLAFFGLLCARI